VCRRSHQHRSHLESPKLQIDGGITQPQHQQPQRERADAALLTVTGDSDPDVLNAVLATKIPFPGGDRSRPAVVIRFGPSWPNLRTRRASTSTPRMSQLAADREIPFNRIRVVCNLGRRHLTNPTAGVARTTFLPCRSVLRPRSDAGGRAVSCWRVARPRFPRTTRSGNREPRILKIGGATRTGRCGSPPACSAADDVIHDSASRRLHLVSTRFRFRSAAVITPFRQPHDKRA